MKRSNYRGLAYQIQNPKTANITSFLGVDYTTPTFSVATNRAIDMLNFIRKDAVLEKRDGFNHIAHISSDKLFNIWKFDNFFILHSGKNLLIYDDITFKNKVKEFKNVVLYQKIDAFIRNDKLYILGGIKFLVLDNDLTLSNVEDVASIPTTTIGIAPTNTENALDVNRLSYDDMNNLTILHKNRLTTGISFSGASETIYPVDRTLVYTLDSNFKLNPDNENQLAKCGITIKYYLGINEETDLDSISLGYSLENEDFSKLTDLNYSQNVWGASDETLDLRKTSIYVPVYFAPTTFKKDPEESFSILFNEVGQEETVFNAKTNLIRVPFNNSIVNGMELLPNAYRESETKVKMSYGAISSNEVVVNFRAFNSVENDGVELFTNGSTTMFSLAAPPSYDKAEFWLHDTPQVRTQISLAPSNNNFYVEIYDFGEINSKNALSISEVEFLYNNDFKNRLVKHEVKQIDFDTPFLTLDSSTCNRVYGVSFYTNTSLENTNGRVMYLFYRYDMYENLHITPYSRWKVLIRGTWEVQ